MCRRVSPDATTRIPLIGLAGQAGSGKDTLAEHLCQAHSFASLALATPLRDGLRIMLGLSLEELTRRDLKEARIDWLGRSPRELSQTLGTEWGRELIHPEIWLRVAERTIARLRQSNPAGIVVTDIRFENEAEWVRAQGGTVWHLRRDQSGLQGATSNHVSEQHIPEIEGDVIVDNIGTIEAFYEQASHLILNRSKPCAA